MKLINPLVYLVFKQIKSLFFILFFTFSSSALQATYYGGGPILRNMSKKSSAYIAFEARKDVGDYLGFELDGSFEARVDGKMGPKGGQISLALRFLEQMPLGAELRNILGKEWVWSSTEPVVASFSILGGRSIELPLSFPSEFSKMESFIGSEAERGIDIDFLCSYHNKPFTLLSEYSQKILWVLLDPTSPIKNVSLTFNFIKRRHLPRIESWKKLYILKERVRLAGRLPDTAVHTSLKHQLGIKENKPFKELFEANTKKGKKVEIIHSGTKCFEKYSVTIPDVPLRNLYNFTYESEPFREAIYQEIKNPHDFFKLLLYKSKLEEYIKDLGLTWTKNYDKYLTERMEELQKSFIKGYREFQEEHYGWDVGSGLNRHLLNFRYKLKELGAKEFNEANQRDLESFIALIEKSIREKNEDLSIKRFLKDYLQSQYFCKNSYTFFGSFDSEERMKALQDYWKAEEQNQLAISCFSYQKRMNPADSIYENPTSYSSVYDDSPFTYDRLTGEKYLEIERDLIFDEIKDLLKKEIEKDQIKSLEAIEKKLRVFLPTWAENSYARKIQRKVKKHLAPKFKAVKSLQDYARKVVLPNSSKKHKASVLMQKVARGFLTKNKFKKKREAANTIREFYLGRKALKNLGSRGKLPESGDSYQTNNSSLAAKRSIPFNLYYESDSYDEKKFSFGAFDEVDLETGKFSKSDYQKSSEFLVADRTKEINHIFIHLDVLSFNKSSGFYEAPLSLPYDRSNGIPTLVPELGQFKGYSVFLKTGQYRLRITEKQVLKALAARESIDSFFPIICYPVDMGRTKEVLLSLKFLEPEKKALAELEKPEWKKIIQSVEKKYEESKECIEKWTFTSNSNDFTSEEEFNACKKRRLATLFLEIPSFLTNYIKTNYKYSKSEDALGDITPIKALNSESFQCDSASAIMLSILKYHFGFQGRMLSEAPAKTQSKRVYLDQKGQYHAVVQVWMPEIEGYSKPELKIFDPTPYLQAD